MNSTLPTLPPVPGTDPSRCVLDSFRIAIAQRVAAALPPLTLEQAYTGVDYGKKDSDFTVALPRFRLPGKVDELAAQVIGQVRPPALISSHLCSPRLMPCNTGAVHIVPSGRLHRGRRAR